MRFVRPVPIAIGISLVLVAGVAGATSTTCTTSTACAAYINSSSGVALHGEANTGIGIRGTSTGSTGFYGASRSGSPLYPGVEGESLDQTGNDAAGAFGLTAQSGGTAPAYGVLAYGSSYGVYADATGSGNGSAGAPTSFAVTGVDPGGTAGQDTNVGIAGTSLHGTAVLAQANVSTSSSVAYNSDLPEAIDAEAEPDKANGNAVALEAVSSFTPVEACNPSTGCFEAALQSLSLNALYFGVDLDGNIVANSVKTKKSTYVRTTGATGTQRLTYSAQATAPVLEDTGEGRLLNGRGYVKLDPAFSDVIDNRAVYRVFLTPDGDSHVLYVTQKSPAGFVVRESRGGHATLSFDYRIIAKPVHDDEQRLALAPPQNEALQRSQLRSPQPSIAQRPSDPFARLRSRLGAAAYARELGAARRLEAAR